jgi:hypothetical protein
MFRLKFNRTLVTSFIFIIFIVFIDLKHRFDFTSTGYNTIIHGDIYLVHRLNNCNRHLQSEKELFVIKVKFGFPVQLLIGKC